LSVHPLLADQALIFVDAFGLAGLTAHPHYPWYWFEEHVTCSADWHPGVAVACGSVVVVVDVGREALG